ncbi:MAG: hypothetical protein FD181_2581 [Prolixibacteraceae bacterium]|nr:MAG: hypothetical protein FD181_2581 [Prolixibacteraceae bacterium]
MKNELEYHKFKGLFLYCNKCDNYIHQKQKGKKCSHPIEKQVYKAIIRTGNGYERKFKTLDARDFAGAVKETLDFEDKVKNPHLYQQSNNPKQSPYLEDTIRMYIDHMHDEEVPHHKKSYLSKSYIESTRTFLKEFKSFIVNSGADFHTYKLSLINDSVVGKFSAYLENKDISNYTFNGHIKAMRIFFNYLIKNKGYNIKNVWKEVKLKSERATNVSISAKDFYDLLSIIGPDDAIAKTGKTKRNMYRPWLKDLIRLKAYTGRRNAELFAMRWNMIHFEEGMPVYIESPNIKVNKQQNNFDEKDYQFVYIPIGEELLDLLMDLNLLENVDSNDHIIAPDSKNRDDMEKQTSKYFTFFFNKLNRNYSRQLKHLRKTYITSEDLYLNSGFSMQHGNYKITDKFYVDKNVIATKMALNGFRIFPVNNKKGTLVGHSDNKKGVTSL